MSPQIIELIIFAGIAFFVINKLLSNLGNTNKKSFFGESPSLKDVTFSVKKEKSKPSRKKELQDIILEENYEQINTGIADVTAKYPTFDIRSFLSSASVAFKMIIESLEKGDSKQNLVDKRYINEFSKLKGEYGEYNAQNNNLDKKISDIYSFGNNLFVKILFSGKNITSKLENLNEEWTFSKNSLTHGNAWSLTNIDKI